MIDGVGGGGFSGGTDEAFGGESVRFAEYEVELVRFVGSESVPAGLYELNMTSGEAEDPCGGGFGSCVWALEFDDLGEHFFCGAEWAGLIEIKAEAEASGVFIFDDEETVEHAVSGASVPGSSVGDDGQPFGAISNFDVVRGFDAFEAEGAGLSED